MRNPAILILIMLGVWPFVQGNALMGQQVTGDAFTPNIFEMPWPVVTEATQLQRESYNHSGVEVRSTKGNSACVILRHFPVASRLRFSSCKQLDLSGFDLVLKGTVGAKTERPSVVEVSFEYCELCVTNKESLGWLANVQSFCLNECDITDTALAALCEVVQRFKKLRCLTLSGSQLGETAIMKWRGVTSLEQLRLGPQGCVTPSAVESLLSSLISLRRMFLGRTTTRGESRKTTIEKARELCVALAKRDLLTYVDVRQLAGLDDTCVELLSGNPNLVGLSLPWGGSYDTTLTEAALVHVLRLKKLSFFSTGTIPVTRDWLMHASKTLPLQHLCISALPFDSAVANISFPHMQSMAMQISGKGTGGQRSFPLCPALRSLHVVANGDADLFPCIQWAAEIPTLTCIRITAAHVRVRDVEELARAKSLKEASLEAIGSADGSLLSAFKGCPSLERLLISTIGSLTVGSWGDICSLGRLTMLVLDGSMLTTTDQEANDSNIKYLSIKKAEWLSVAALSSLARMRGLSVVTLEVTPLHSWTNEERQILLKLEGMFTFVTPP